MVEVKISFDLGGGLARTLAGRWWCRDWWGRYFEDDKYWSASSAACMTPRAASPRTAADRFGRFIENMACPFVWTKSAKHSQKLELCFNSLNQCVAWHWRAMTTRHTSSFAPQSHFSTRTRRQTDEQTSHQTLFS